MEKDLLSRYIPITTASILYEVHRVKLMTISISEVLTYVLPYKYNIISIQNYRTR